MDNFPDFKSNASASRARAILDRLVQGKILTPEGLAWLTIAVDPWHDTAVKGMNGMPDQGIGKSVTFQVVQEYQISKLNSPVPLPAGNWSCRIGNYPWLTTQTLNPGLFFGEIVTQQPASTSVFGVPVQVNYAPDGADFSSVAVNVLGNAQGCQVPTEFLQGVTKVCGMGIEVINTTAILNKQGLMSCARMVQPDVESYTSYVAFSNAIPPVPVNAWAIKSLTPFRTLPKNLTELALYPGFAQEEAKDGYYAPVLFRFDRFPHYPTPYGTVLLEDDPHAGPFDTSNPITCYSSHLTPFNLPAGEGNTTTFYSSRELPLYYGCDSNVVFFTGLSESTTLNLRVRWILERFPSDQEKQVLVIATPSASYDPVALEIYSRAVQMLPSGVPFTENPAGEWWKTMLAAIGKVAAPMLGMLPSPIGKALGAAIPIGIKALEGTFDEQTKIQREQQAIARTRAAERRNKSKLKGAVNQANGGVKQPQTVIQAVATPGKRKKKQNGNR
jgi:hypothetical protein